MSEHLNGDTAPRGLGNALRVMRGEVQKIQKTMRRQRRQGFVKSPRQFCAVCGKVWDYAVVDPNATMTKGICPDCKVKLSEGYTACITSDAYAFVKSDYLKQHGMAGKIVPVTQAVYDKLKEKQQNAVPDIKPPDASP